jgi:hypothetical protein
MTRDQEERRQGLGEERGNEWSRLSLFLSWLVRGCGVNYGILRAVNGVFD